MGFEWRDPHYNAGQQRPQRNPGKHKKIQVVGRNIRRGRCHFPQEGGARVKGTDLTEATNEQLN